MFRSSLSRILLAAIGGLVGAGLMLGILFLANGGNGFARCTGTTTYGWIVPLVGGIAIGIVSLLLIDSGNDKRSFEEATETRDSVCPSCGNPILDGWRLCPDCGQLLECQIPATGVWQAGAGV